VKTHYELLDVPATATIAQQRRVPSAKVTIVPVNGRTWEAHVPTDAPAVAKSVLARLKAA
jgi:hypothetical protein